MISAPPMKSPYSFSLLADARDDAPLGVEATIVSMPPLARSGISVRKRSWIVRWMTVALARAARGRVQRLGDDRVAAQLADVVDPLVGVDLEHLLGGVLRAVEPLALERRRAFARRGAARSARRSRRSRTRARCRMNQILDRNIRVSSRYSAALASCSAFSRSRWETTLMVSSSLPSGGGVDLLLGDPLAARPHLQRGVAVGDVGDREAALLVDGREVGRPDDEHARS